MAKKISQLTQATEVKSDDVTVIVQDGETKKLPLNMMVTKQDIEDKKVAGLAKLDEIEATYENDTYTPTITVKNKSSVKVGEGDGVDYSANVMDGHAKSAILKGNTLVNLLSDDKFEGSATIRGWDFALSYPLTTNKTYLLIVNVTKDDTDYGWNCRFTNGTNYPIYQTDIKGTGIKKIKFTPSVELTKFSPYFQLEDWNNGKYVTLENMMVLEYQDGMENWDIPYFTGMQSVKVPVLTTTGKNTWNTNKMIISIDDGLKNVQCFANSIKLTNSSQSWKGFVVKNDQSLKYLSFNASASEVNDTTKYIRVSSDGTQVGRYDLTKGRIVVQLPENSQQIKIQALSTNGNDVEFEFIDIQLEKESFTSYEPFKTNILTVNEEVTLRGIGDVSDTLDCLTGEVNSNFDEMILTGDEVVTNWATSGSFFIKTSISNQHQDNNKILCLSDKIPSSTVNAIYRDTDGISSIDGKFVIRLTGLTTSEEVSNWLKQNAPIRVLYATKEKSIKTVDLIPSGTHPSTTPYCWKDGHIQLSSSGLLPSLEYSVVTSRAGQISQNAAMIVKNDKRIFDLEILLAGGLVNTTYQALTLQNQVETGLSKVSLSSETEPDYLLYHMIMKLIEEKAYKLDDLTEKVSVFYLYEKLSDEQFETIYSALYPFVEDEIVEEPIVDELPKEVEDEVVM